MDLDHRHTGIAVNEIQQPDKVFADRSSTGYPQEYPAPADRSDIRKWKIYYLCPDTPVPSAGIRRLYRHIELLNAAGFRSAILHLQEGFRMDDMPVVPLEYLKSAPLTADTIVVIPEGMTAIMDALKDHPCRRFVIALNWDYIFKNLPDATDWRTFNIERVVVIAPFVGELVSWSMGLPVHRIDSSIDHRRYEYRPDQKQPQVSFIRRKAVCIDQLKRLLGARNRDYIHKIRWVGLSGLSEAEYARQLCKSTVFVNASLAEGYPTSCLEAMAAGTIVAGYDAGGGRDLLCGQGRDQNCILAPTGDYLSLAYAMEPVLRDCLQGKMDKWACITANGRNLAAGLTLHNENASLTSFWRKVCSCN